MKQTVRRFSLAVAMCMALGVVPVVATAGPSAADGSHRALLAYDRAADYDAVSTDIRVPMRDGQALRCTLYRPGHGDSPAEGRFPGIVMDFVPYRLAQDHAFSQSATWFAGRGYVVLMCSVRGTGGSAGTWTPFSAQEQRDNVDLIEWLATQPFSTGKVGQTGESYGGINSYRAAAAHPPHLVAIAPVISWKSPFDEIWYKGGIRSTVFRWWPFVTWGLATPDQSPAALASMAERAAAYETDANAHPTHDAYWQAQEVDIAAVDRSDVAVLGIGGWGDLFPKGMVDNYRGARDQSWLLMFPHAHVELGPGLPGFPPELDHARLAWFDRWLAGRADAPLPASKVTSWEMPRDGGRWRQLADLPDRPAGEVLQLTGTGALAVDTGPPTSHTYTVNPFDTSCACSDRGGYTPPAVATDQQVADRSRLHFDTGPLAAPVVVAGNPEVHLRIALSAADTNLVVHLEDIGPDGRAILMTSGWLRASFRESAANPAPLEPGRPYDITVQMWPTHWRVPAGHGLRLSITSGDLNSIEPNAPPGSVTLLVGDGRSTLTVPTIAS